MFAELPYRIWYYLGILFFAYTAQLMMGVRLWDLGVGTRMGRISTAVIMAPTVAIAAGVAAGQPFGIEIAVWLVSVIASVAAIYWMEKQQLSRQVELTSVPLDGEAGAKLAELAARVRAQQAASAGVADRRPEVLIVDCEDAAKVMEWLSTRHAVVVPAWFRREAGNEECIAFGARQLVTPRMRLILANIMPSLWAMAACTWAKIHGRPDVAAAAGVASLVGAILLARASLRWQDRFLDQAVVALTGDAEACCRAIQLAERRMPLAPRYPFWFRRDPAAVRCAAICDNRT